MRLLQSFFSHTPFLPHTNMQTQFVIAVFAALDHWSTPDSAKKPLCV